MFTTNRRTRTDFVPVESGYIGAATMNDLFRHEPGGDPRARLVWGVPVEIDITAAMVEMRKRGSLTHRTIMAINAALGIEGGDDEET